jgi:glycopeptide antibiotics resistance protein
MILFRTLLNRNIWTNPLVDVIGPWSLYRVNGVLNTDIIENTIMMIPFAFCLFWCNDETFLKRHTFFYTCFQGLKYAFCFSLTIETLQLVLFLGTFQLSDIFFNTLGGLIGGLLYFIYFKFKHRHA